jgi:hypothetical protein
MVLGAEDLTVASIRCREETVKTVRVFISGSYKNWEFCAVMVILGVLTFLRGCGRLRAKIAIKTDISKGLSFSIIPLIDSQ